MLELVSWVCLGWNREDKEDGILEWEVVMVVGWGRVWGFWSDIGVLF